MHVVSPGCCSIDVHQAWLTACLRRGSVEGAGGRDFFCADHLALRGAQRVFLQGDSVQ